MEVKLLSFAGIPLLAALGCLGYAVHKSPRLGPRGRAVALASLLPILLLTPVAVLCAYGPLHSKMAHFAASIFGVIGAFRWLELVCGTGPEGFDRSLKNFVVYFAWPSEILFARDGSFQASKPGLLNELIFRIAMHLAVGTVVLSIGRATSFAPFLAEGTDPVTLPWFGFPHALPAIYLQAAYVYFMLATAMLMHRLPPALVGVDTVDSMQAPLLLSSGVRDFWGRRWNLTIHRLIKRSFFAPLASRGGWARHLGGFVGFLISGLFHEYMWFALALPDMCSYVPGLATLFMVLQYLFCAIEAALARTAIGRWAAKLPWPLPTLATTLVILPVGPLFLHGILGMAVEMARQGQTITILAADSPVPAGAGRWPPSDWALLALAAALALALRAWMLLRHRGVKAKEGSRSVVLVRHDSNLHGA